MRKIVKSIRKTFWEHGLNPKTISKYIYSDGSIGYRYDSQYRLADMDEKEYKWYEKWFRNPSRPSLSHREHAYEITIQKFDPVTEKEIKEFTTYGK